MRELWPLPLALAAALLAVLGLEYAPVSIAVVAGLSFACGAYARLAAGAAGAIVLLTALLVTNGESFVPEAIATAGPWLAGRVVRSRSRLVGELARRTRELEAEQDSYARLAVRHERARMARELHDIVAHHLAVMVVQAGAGRMAEHDGPERAAERFTSIGEAGDQALEEMVRLVDILHEGERDDVQLVLDRARSAGLTIAATLPAGDAELPDTALRIVQESLTNTLKHAPGADVDVRLEHDDGGLEIEVRDRGGTSRPTLAETGAGLGLAGLRERVEDAGGRLDAGPLPAGGWRVHARLPL